jgi:hypothetical protein
VQAQPSLCFFKVNYLPSVAVESVGCTHTTLSLFKHVHHLLTTKVLNSKLTYDNPAINITFADFPGVTGHFHFHALSLARSNGSKYLGLPAKKPSTSVTDLGLSYPQIITVAVTPCFFYYY